MKHIFYWLFKSFPSLRYAASDASNQLYNEELDRFSAQPVPSLTSNDFVVYHLDRDPDDPADWPPNTWEDTR